MQPWKNFLCQQPMNPYQNNYAQPMSFQNPYMDRINPLQQYWQNLQQSAGQPQGIIGRMVKGFGEVTTNGILMKENAAFFQKTDRSELQVQSWPENVTIQSVVYKPVFEQSQINTLQLDFNTLNEDVKALRKDIKDLCSMIEKSMCNSADKVASSKTKREELPQTM